MKAAWLFVVALAGCGPEAAGPDAASPEAASPNAAVAQVAPSPNAAPATQTTAPTAAKPAPAARGSSLPTSRVPPGPKRTTGAGDDDDGDPPVEEQGPLTDTQRSVFRAVGLCLQKSEKHGEHASGSLAVELSIDTAGKVTSVDFGPGYPPSAKACAEPRLKAIQFPPEANSGLRTIRYPINETPPP